jgi:DNA-binding CsgD family transcriptional regulator
VQDSDVQDSEPNDGVKGVGGGSLVDMVVVVSTSVIGLVLFAIASNAQIGVISTTGPSNTSIGMAGSSLIIAIAASIFRRTSLLPFTYSILFPVVAGLLVILDSAALGSMLFQLGAAGVFFFFSAIAVFSIVYILAVSIKGEFAAPQVVGVSLALLSVASLIGHLLANPGVDSIEFGSVFLVICTCYFIFVLLAPAIQSWRERHLETESSSASSETAVEEFYMSKCAAIAQDYYLSQRESEVLYYVGKGYNASYISKALYISDGTARTHLNNIYHKLGVNSKMQIIDMFGN